MCTMLFPIGKCVLPYLLSWRTLGYSNTRAPLPVALEDTGQSNTRVPLPVALEDTGRSNTRAPLPLALEDMTLKHI